MTYVAQFVYKYPEVRSYQGESLSVVQKQYDEFVSWLTYRTKYLSEPQHISSNFLVRTIEYYIQFTAKSRNIFISLFQVYSAYL